MGRSEDIAELRTAADRLLAKIDALSADSSAADPARPCLFEGLYQLRRLRDEVFAEPGLFADPAWDILLGLARAERAGRQSSITDLCQDSCVPMTTALRYIRQLENLGLIEISEDRSDGRRRFARLTDETRDRMSRIAGAAAKV